jgi:Cytochrome c7 and related cytochrome c
MAPFSPRANRPYRLALAGLAGLAVGVPLAPFAWRRDPTPGGAPQQPIPFDHRHHVQDRRIACVYCHETVETDAGAGMPSTERCMGCHHLLPERAELAPLRESAASHTPIRWKRVTALPGYVYFHHGVHVQNGIACAECHGNVEDMPRIARAHRMTMDFCLGCHREHVGRAISRLTTCSACHR